MDIAKILGMSFEALFADLQTAFASIARVIAFPAPASMVSFAAKLFNTGFEKEEIYEIVEELQPMSIGPRGGARNTFSL